ncbi:hypothetical protein TGME49_300052 [Toxoplasma gondii ME49]|uniref:Uncharacterized protein n=11 Tax=Toxoplasma gondii TaxID=5811 RepID=A0A125YZ74_TOXGV|nr:hypothetical protein TGME49_300052 [Toxoplasma gondii ME49]EPR56939.1 hypothetical protein TGGT1_300052 [Toxoplasma gondii GT1]ESS28412.1 hypothetical protein TGVEG_300052 [Toxoplasma gondii VEG]KAF4638123.1 hypothetical protein TGRH88_057320 [Toxoplasma gondii]KFG28766.1 hypothetical protein TGP89_300052 [Toxoplasma gondii p89]KFG34584.1 hypothetical protein TGFOU_300052 [Toxoplasma gondii FOU]KFG47907.1 hypothetical protein TGDOM2_300052 [Toxoplasma gondii GAB2-2007-GAL-DOM2]KFH04388.1 |eukprot:XP_018635200.1 hypothetical protein TGME49_300052 [Toxoplasma gondii ME49]
MYSIILCETGGSKSKRWRAQETTDAGDPQKAGDGGDLTRVPQRRPIVVDPAKQVCKRPRREMFGRLVPVLPAHPLNCCSLRLASWLKFFAVFGPIGFGLLAFH